MRRSWIGGVWAMGVLSVPFATGAFAHPASGIVVDPQGQVFFQDSLGRAIWQIDGHGQLTKYSDKLGGHWMALDTEGHFARADLKLVERITPSGLKPTLLVAGGGAPLVVNRDGNLYYGLRLLAGDKVTAGLTQISPDGKRTLFAPADLNKTVEKLGISGLATGPDGSLYVACPSAILKVNRDGTFQTLVHPVVVKDCDVDFPDNNPNYPMPALRGVAVDSRGTVYAAATGCHCVVKFTPSGKIETILKAERPWSPTGVAVFGEDVYVLEYTNANAGPNSGWLPRVRKLARDGKVTILATVAREK